MVSFISGSFFYEWSIMMDEALGFFWRAPPHEEEKEEVDDVQQYGICMPFIPLVSG